jgi:hypothetical protein
VAQAANKQISDLYSRWGYLKSERASWWSHWKEISDYLLPRSGRFFVQDRDRGYRRHNNIYDSTGTRALRVLGAGLMGGATSPARPWFRLATPDPDLMKYPSVKVWLNDITRTMLDIFQRSNTYRTLHGIYEELGAFGTAASVVMDDYNEVTRHFPLTVGEFAIATDYRGTVNTLFREFQRPVGAVVAEFGINNVSNTVKNMHSRGQLDSWVTLVHAIEPRIDRDPRLKDNKNMAFKSCYFELGRDNDKYLREGGMKRFQALCPRWSVIGGDIYGNSPGMETLGDIKQLQHEQLRKAEGIDLMTKPPLQGPAAMKNREVDRFPGGFTYSDTAGGSGIKTMFDVRLDLNHLLQDIQDVRERIKATFYTDLFLMLSSDQMEGRMTATEVAERHEEKLLMLGPVLERLHNELFQPLIEMTFQRMLEAGIVPPAPPELHGKGLQIEFISMLAQAQRAVSTNSVDRFVVQMGTIAQLGGGSCADVLDKFDRDKWADKYSDMLGIDPELIVADSKVALVRKQRAAAQEKQQKLAMMEQGSKTAKNLAQAPTNGSNALTDVMSGLQGYSTPQSGGGQ